VSASWKDYVHILENGESYEIKGTKVVEGFIKRGLGILGFDDMDMVIAKDVERISLELKCPCDYHYSSDTDIYVDAERTFDVKVENRNGVLKVIVLCNDTVFVPSTRVSALLKCL